MKIKGQKTLDDLQHILSLADKYVEQHELWHQDRLDHFGRFVDEYERDLLDMVKENKLPIFSKVKEEIYQTLRQQEVIRVQREIDDLRRSFKGLDVSFCDRIKILFTGKLNK